MKPVGLEKEIEEVPDVEGQVPSTELDPSQASGVEEADMLEVGGANELGLPQRVVPRKPVLALPPKKSIFAGLTFVNVAVGLSC